jgi:hypothetical protein
MERDKIKTLELSLLDDDISYDFSQEKEDRIFEDDWAEFLQKYGLELDYVDYHIKI